MLPGAGFCQPHQVFDVQVVVQLLRLVRRQPGGLFPANQVLDAFLGCLGWAEATISPGLGPAAIKSTSSSYGTVIALSP